MRTRWESNNIQYCAQVLVRKIKQYIQKRPKNANWKHFGGIMCLLRQCFTAGWLGLKMVAKIDF